MIFFTTYITIIRCHRERAEKRLGTPARVEGSTIRLPTGTDVQVGDYVEHRLPNDEQRRMVVIDAIHPHMLGASREDDHIEVTCAPLERVTVPHVRAPALHPAMSVPLALAEDGRMSEAVYEALGLVEERVRLLTASERSGQLLMESVFGTNPPRLSFTTTTGQEAEDEREGFRHLFIGALLGLRGLSEQRGALPAALDETWEYLAVASMLMRRLDRAERGPS
ncbi:MAG: TIGR02391 family protein [Pseudonocardiaceae bacterium]